MNTYRDIPIKSVRRLLVCCLLLPLIVTSCSRPPAYTPEDPHWRDNDTKNIDDPGKRKPSLIWETVTRTSFEQAEQLLDFPRDVRKITGNPRQSLNINSFDEVPDCAWYTNRHARQPFTAEQFKHGAVIGSGPDTSGSWTVVQAKVQGATPGFWIEDAAGDLYILKFDAAGYPELQTGAAAISSRYFYAMGYNVPQETIVYWRPENLHVKEDLRFKDRDGVNKEFTQQSLEEVLARVDRMPDGRIRSLASKALPNVRGPFSYRGTRDGDPNDWCPHQHRRELRGLYVFASLINHWDIKDQNTLDIYVEEDGRQFLKHYLIDFGNTFGARGSTPQRAYDGYRNSFDLRDALVSLFTLGLKQWPWEDAESSFPHPSIGPYESNIFNPGKWDAIYPIPSFEIMTDRDAFWAAKQVMSLRDDDLRALIEAAQYSDPEAAAYLLETMKARRDKIGSYWFGKVNPLDRFKLTRTDDAVEISFDDLAVAYGLELSGTSRYRYQVKYDGSTVISDRPFDGTKIRLDRQQLADLTSALSGVSTGDDPKKHLVEINIQTKRFGSWSQPVLLWLWYHPDNARFQLVGIEHLD
ncbi:MAG: hypothetical protein ABII79_00215 [bacterium]